MGLKQENFIDRIYITVTATGAAATGLAPTCTFIDESDNRTAGTVAEMANGWYKITDFTPDADGTWCTEWAVAGAYTIHYPFKEFKVGGGQEADTQGSGFDTATDSLVKLHDDHVTEISATRLQELDAANLPADVDAILVDTNELQTDWVNGGRLDLLIDAIKAKTDNLPADPADDSDIDAQLSTIVTDTNELQTDWTNGGRLDLLIDAIKAKTDNLPADPADDSDIDAQLARKICHMDFWSDIAEEIQIGAGDESGVIAMGDVVVADIPAGATITRVVAMFMCRSIENTNASANAVDVATGHIQVKEKVAGTYQTSINIPDNAFGIAGSTREMGTIIIGDNDIASEVDANDTYTFELDDIGTDLDFLNFNDCQWGLRVYFY